jgi:hypothetical protein
MKAARKNEKFFIRIAEVSVVLLHRIQARQQAGAHSIFIGRLHIPGHRWHKT